MLALRGKCIYPHYVIGSNCGSPMARRCFPGMKAVVLFVLVLSVAAAISVGAWRHSDGGERAASVLEAYYSGTIVVNVTDEVGRPIAGATVWIYGNTTNFPVTDALGSLQISGLLADVNGTIYTLWAGKTGYDNSSLTYVNVNPANTSYADLVIHGGVVLGTVTDSDGPIAGATVSIVTLGYSNLTGADGSYWLYEIPGGVTHSVTASAVGYDNQTKEVVVHTGDVVRVDFLLLSKTGSISGTVVHAATLEPLSGANISIKVGDVTVTVGSDYNGSYRIPSLPGGTYSLAASLAGFNSTTLTGITVVKGVETEDVDFALEERPTRLYGVVKAGTFLLPGVNISVVGTDYSAISSIEGEYEIKDIPAGTYSLLVTKGGYISTTVVGVVVPRGGEKLQNIELVGLPGALRGVVYASYDPGLPLAGVTVTILDPSNDRSTTTTNINGEFEFTGLMEGNYTVYFELDGFKPMEMGPFLVDPEGTVTLNQVLLEPVREGFGGFIFGFDLAHSMMVIALALTIAIMMLAAALRIRTFEAPDKSPAVYDQAEEQLENGPEDASGTEKEPEKEDVK